jgi:hypothetical protein
MFKARLRQFCKKNMKQGFPSKSHTVNEYDLQYSSDIPNNLGSRGTVVC